MSDQMFLLIQACALWNSGDRETFHLTEVLPGEGVLWKNTAEAFFADDLVGVVDIDEQGQLTPAAEQTSFATTTTSQP